jgi:hypothetical protein
MNKKHSLREILHNADLRTIEKISENNALYDERTRQRVYEKYLQKTAEKRDGTGAYSEVFTVERHNSRFVLKMAGMTALCAVVTGGVILGFRNMKAPEPNNDSEPPIFFNETTVVTTVTSESGTKITVKTTTTKSSENTYTTIKKSVSAQSVTDSKNDKGEDTSKSNDSTAKTTTKQNSKKNTTTTTTESNITPVRQKVETPADGRMTMQKVMEFIEYYGETMTWADFEPYEHEDITPAIDVVYKAYGWIIPVYENGIHKYTLAVLGITTNEKPSSVNFYKSTQTEQQTFIDIRYEDIAEFLSEDYDLANALNFVNNTTLIKNIEVSGPDSTHNTFLGQSEMKEILPLIKDIELIKKEESTSSTMYYNIDITINDHFHHNIKVQYPYLIIDGTGYRTEDTGLNALIEYVASIVESHRPSEPIDVNGVWCWHDNFTQHGDFRNITDSIRIRQFPDIVFDWHGKTYTVAAYDNDGNEYGSTSVRFSAYFADLNGDGYPELCSTNICESNSMAVLEADVWDIRSNKHYSLVSPDEYNYYFYEENGELFVNKKAITDLGWNVDSSQGEKGKIGFDGDNIVFVSIN